MDGLIRYQCLYNSLPSAQRRELIDFASTYSKQFTFNEICDIWEELNKKVYGAQNLGEGLFGKVGNISNEHKARLDKHHKQLEEVKSFSPPKEIIDELYLEDGRSFKEILNDIEEACQEWIDATTLIKDTSLLNIK